MIVRTPCRLQWPLLTCRGFQPVLHRICRAGDADYVLGFQFFSFHAYLLTGYRIYFVVGRLKYRKYACASSALYLQHPVSRYRRICTYLLRSYFQAGYFINFLTIKWLSVLFSYVIIANSAKISVNFQALNFLPFSVSGHENYPRRFSAVPL